MSNKENFVSKEQLQKYFCDVLRGIRGTRSQREMATLLGLRSQQSYAYYETGKVSPRLDEVSQWAGKLGINPKVFFAPFTGVTAPPTHATDLQKSSADLAEYMGFQTVEELYTYLVNAEWERRRAAVKEVEEKAKKRKGKS